MTTLTLPEFEARCVRVIKALRFTEPVVPTEEIVATFHADLLRLLAGERERCAMLHELMDPASDSERLSGSPGAGAIGAIIRYRDAIRQLGDPM